MCEKRITDFFAYFEAPHHNPWILPAKRSTGELQSQELSSFRPMAGLQAM